MFPQEKTSVRSVHCLPSIKGVRPGYRLRARLPSFPWSATFLSVVGRNRGATNTFYQALYISRLATPSPVRVMSGVVFTSG